jgi:hypothetical protein
MRRIGQLLMFLGLGVGGIVGLSILLHLDVPGVPWLVAVGLTKLALVASGGMLAGGAFLQRLGARRHHPTVNALIDGRSTHDGR